MYTFVDISIPSVFDFIFLSESAAMSISLTDRNPTSSIFCQDNLNCPSINTLVDIVNSFNEVSIAPVIIPPDFARYGTTAVVVAEAISDTTVADNAYGTTALVVADATSASVVYGTTADVVDAAIVLAFATPVSCDPSPVFNKYGT